MAIKVMFLFVCGMPHAMHATADSNEAMKIGNAMSKFMPAGQMPRPVAQDIAATPSSPSIVKSGFSMQLPVLKTLGNMEERNQEMLQRLRASRQNMPQADDQASVGLATAVGWLAFFFASAVLAASVGVAVVKKLSGRGQHGSETTLDSRISLVPQHAGPTVASLTAGPSRSGDLHMSSEAGLGLTVCGLSVPHARTLAGSRALDVFNDPSRLPAAKFPYSDRDLSPMMAGNDGLFYFVPKFVQHAGDECRESLTKFYEVVLPPSGTGDVLDLCSSWTSHYPKGWRGKRCVALGLNYAELAVNPSKTEYKVQDLNADPKLPFDDASFDVITNSLSVDYMTRPLELFAEMHRVLKPGGYACMAFTNRCFPTKVVPVWTKPYTELHHAEIVGNYFRYSADWAGGIGVADVSPAGRVGLQDPMVVVIGRKAE